MHVQNPVSRVGQSIATSIADFFEREKRSELICFGCVIASHIENDFNASFVSFLYHSFEFQHLFTVSTPSKSNERLERRIPTVRQASIFDVSIHSEMLDGHHFDGGDPAFLEIADRHGMSDGRVHSSNLWLKFSETFDAQFVDLTAAQQMKVLLNLI